MANMDREASSRAATARAAIGGDHKGRLHVDPASLDPSCDYQWIRESTLGERDEGSLMVAMDESGFTPVEAKELPGAAGAKLPGAPRSDGLIRRGGLILMKRPKELAQVQREAQEAANHQAVAGVTKNLSEGLDGRNFQQMDGGGVSVVTESLNGAGQQQRFQE
jgi:hypothetical protein